MPIIGRFNAYEKLYEHGHSLVYRARDKAHDRDVVLKILKLAYPTPEQLARFRAEYELTRNLTLEGVVRVHGLEKHDHSLIMVLEDFGGESLSKLMPSLRLDLADFLQLAIRIADILGEIHQHNTIHKDVNPSNIVWNRESDQVKIIDFGISTVLSRQTPSIRNPNQLEGNLPYISPEQTGRMNRSMDYRTDFYSLGVTLYELLTGDVPFVADDPMELVHCHIAKLPVAPHLVAAQRIKGRTPAVVGRIVMKLLAKRAEERYQSVFGLRADLETCLAQLNAHGQINPAYPIGQNDISDRFQIPEALYGRELDVAALLEAFDRVGLGGKELVLVTGQSGMGKSSAVREIHKPIVRQRGYYAAGKFDPLKRDIPYFAWVQAFRDLVRQILSEPAARIAQWRESMEQALRPNGRVMVDVIPEVELIIGPQTALPTLPPSESQNRFEFTFQKFVRLFAGPSHPLVIFLDDLQSADPSSLGLLNIVLTDPETRHLLVVGAYRCEEVDSSHPLRSALAEAADEGAVIQTIELGSLDLYHVSALIADTLHTDVDAAQPLAEICVDKTHGNPFFLNQFLETLYKESYIDFDRDEGRWRWDTARIRGAEITRNVRELLAARIGRLEARTRHVLQLAACLGPEFDLKTLAAVNDKPVPETADDLWEAVRENLIVPIEDTHTYLVGEVGGALDEMALPLVRDLTYRFVHDRVQQEAYALIDEAPRRAIHHRIGRLLQKTVPPDDPRIFDIVNHLNRGRDHITEVADRDALAALNLEVGRQAKSKAAYAPALAYLQTGIDLLGGDRWSRRYESTLALTTEAADVAYLSADYPLMEQLGDEVLDHAKTLLDQTRIHEIRITYTTHHTPKATLQTALPLLRQLGVDLPARPGRLRMVTTLVRAWLAVPWRASSIERLRDKAPMQDANRLAAIRILQSMASALAANAPWTLKIVVVLERILLVTRHGNHPHAAFDYSNYGTILCAMGRYDTGRAFGRLALEMLGGHETTSIRAKTLLVYHRFIGHWHGHLAETLSPLRLAHRIGMDTGDIEFAGYAILSYFAHAYLLGRPLAPLEAELAAHIEASRRFKHDLTIKPLGMYHQSLLNLMARGDDPNRSPCRLVGPQCDEDGYLAEFREGGFELGIAVLYLLKLKLACVFDLRQEAAEIAQASARYAEFVRGQFYHPTFCFYDSLARLAVFGESDAPTRRQIRKRVGSNQRKLRRWAGQVPQNHRHRYHLVEAECARVWGKMTDAREHYDQAIALARAHDFLVDEAIAHERAARYYLDRSLGHMGHHYLRDAHAAYSRWGAVAKARQLEARYPHVLSAVQRSPFEAALSSSAPGAAVGPVSTTASLPASTTVPTTRTTRTTSKRESSTALDLISVLKASQALSSEIVLERLLATLMENVLENAGAQRGVLLLEREAQWVIEARGELETGAVQVLESTPMRDPDNPAPVALTIIDYVARTYENVVLDDAAHEGAFTQDPHIATQQLKSILCTPLLHNGRLVGMLYLENNLTSGAFTPERLAVLRMLSAQAAISIDHARTYAELEASERKYRTLFEDSRDAIFVARADGRIVDFNPAGLQLLGYTYQEALHTRVQDFYVAAPEHDPFPGEATLPDAPIDTERAAEVLLRRRDGTAIDALLTTTRRLNEDGSVWGYQGIIRDITERKRRLQAERRLEAYRSSPIGRAEALAQALQPRRTHALSELHRLTQGVGQDPAVDHLLGNLPQAFGNLREPDLAALAEGFNYVVVSRSAPELLAVGVRTLIGVLDSPASAEWHGRTEAQAIYRLCQSALEASSVAQVLDLIPALGQCVPETDDDGSIDSPDASLSTEPSLQGTAPDPTIDHCLGDLMGALGTLQPVTEALYAVQRVATPQDKLAYLASAVERLGHVDRSVRAGLGAADRPIVTRIVQSWLAVVTGTMGELQTGARIVCQLVTRRVWRDEAVALALALRNDGMGTALNIEVTLLRSAEYTRVDRSASVDRLLPGEEARVELQARPTRSANDSERPAQFRARFVIRYADPRGPAQSEHFADEVSLIADEGSFRPIANPYVVGTPLRSDSPLFFGREPLLASIEENLHAAHRNHMVLIGQRRMGKTSLLKRLQSRLSDAYLPVYVDGQSLALDPGMASFFVNLGTEIAFAMEDRGFEIDPPDPDALEDAPAAAFEHRFLARVRAVIGSPARHILILLDEFEELESAVRRGVLDASIFGFLRHMMQHVEGLSVIFCGTHRLEELAADYWNVLFNTCLYQYVGFLERTEALRLIREPVAPFGMRYDDLSLDKMLRVTAAHPYFLQLLCHSLVKHHNRSERSYMTVADVDAALEEILGVGEAHFVYLWTESSVHERLALTALSRMLRLSGRVTPVQVGDYLAERGIGLPRLAISEALYRLGLRDILEARSGAERAGGGAYRWRLGLFGLWVEKYKSLGRVNDEVQA